MGDLAGITIFVMPIGNQRARLVTRNFAAYKVFVLPTLIFARRTSFKMKLIPLTQGYFAKVDDSDFEELSKYKWRINKVGARIYATRTILTERGRRGMTMHRHLLKETDRNVDIDHRDGDQLNNQRYNLRRATRTQNNANQKISARNSSGYKGVHFCVERRKWVARVANKHLGRFDNIKDAAMAYNNAAKSLWGQFARLNEIE